MYGMNQIKFNVMAAGKKSFVLYSDQKELFESLPDEQAGKLIKHIFKYVNDENPQCEDALVNLAFVSVKASLKRDLQKWEKQLEQRSLAGKASAEKRKQSLTESNENQRPLEVVHETQRKSTDNVSVSVSDNVNVNDIKKKDIPTKSDVPVDENKSPYKERLKDFDSNCEKMLMFYNRTFQKQSRVVNQKVKDKLKKLLYDYDWKDIGVAMLEVKKSQHHAENGYRWATLEFFTRPDKIEMYAFSSEAKPEYQGEDAKLVNYVANYYKS
jgi:hypothetical protein